jgi:hypothetical protein
LSVDLNRVCPFWPPFVCFVGKTELLQKYEYQLVRWRSGNRQILSPLSRVACKICCRRASQSNQTSFKKSNVLKFMNYFRSECISFKQTVKLVIFISYNFFGSSLFHVGKSNLSLPANR